MATASKLVLSHVTKDPAVCGGKACIDQTRVRIIDIVQLQREGTKPDEMRVVFPVPLTLAQIYSALAYAEEHPEEIAADFASEASTEGEIEGESVEFLKRHSGPEVAN